MLPSSSLAVMHASRGDAAMTTAIGDGDDHTPSLQRQSAVR